MICFNLDALSLNMYKFIIDRPREMTLIFYPAKTGPAMRAYFFLKKHKI